MAKLLNEDLECFGDALPEGHILLRVARLDDSPQPLSQEWFRAHPQWSTDRLMNLENTPE